MPYACTKQSKIQQKNSEYFIYEDEFWLKMFIMFLKTISLSKESTF